MFESMKRGMSNTRSKFTEQMNILLGRGPAVDDEFWDGLEEALILADVGASAAFDIVERMRDTATRRALPDAYAVMDALTEEIAATFATSEINIFDENPVLVLFVGINGAGKTTTVGKIANAAKRAGRNVLLGSADTFRAAAIEQLEEWGRRSDVEIVQRERGADPASVCYDTIERAEAAGADFVLIDTAGRLHTSDDLMRELGKVVAVVRKRSNMPVRTVLVIDATTGQNGLSQARLFNKELELDALVVTKLDGTAKGGIALAVSHELNLPIAMIGVGEGLTDLQVFDPEEFAAALIGAEPVDEAPLEDAGTPDGDYSAPESPQEGLTQEAPLPEDAQHFDAPVHTSSVPSPHAQEEGTALVEEETGVLSGEMPSAGISEDHLDYADTVEAVNADGGFSWKDDFGNPDEMVDALGAQRELVVVTEEEGDGQESAVEEAAAQEEADGQETGAVQDAGALGEEEAVQEQEPPKKEGFFKRAWRWLQE